MDPELMKKLPHRNEGGSFKIGEEGDGNISDMIPLKDYEIVIVTRKSVWRVMLADNIDPQRNNANIPRHVQERLLSYGSDDPIVGRTLLQGKELLLQHLPDTINKYQGMQPVLAFTKELAAMNDELKKLHNEYTEIQGCFDGSIRDDGSFVLPALKNLDRRAKELIQNIDHMGGIVIEITKLFPIEIPQKNPLGKLIEQTEQKYGNEHAVTKAISELNQKAGWWRLLRNDMEHPDVSGMVTFENYKMTESAKIEMPLIKHARENSPFQSVDLIQFIVESQGEIINLFETTLVLLCDSSTEDFARNKVFVRNVTERERTEVNPYMNYRYDINWTR